ncbi:MAG: hypothetical protein HYR60_18440, partial [Acidobacteria bacterium]|nr:hypothetical protein [Acidobacteriota bacterium]
SNGRVIERTVRRYDPGGGDGRPDIVRIEERRNPDGSLTVQAVTYRSDLNGNKQVVERVTTDTRKGAAVETTTVVERPSINGGLQTSERTQSVERASGNSTQTEATTYRADASGNLYPAAREVKVVEKSGNLEKTDSARYEPGSSGRMELSARTVGKVKTNPDGSQVEEIEVYGRRMAFNASDVEAAAPRLQQQIVTQRSAPGPGNVVVEKTSVRGRLPADPSRFGDYEEVTKVTRTTVDPAGREVKNIESTVGRRDSNGRLQAQEVIREQSVETKAAPK